MDRLTTITIPLLLCLWAVMPQGVSAQERQEDGKHSVAGWYGGVQGGVPFGISTFSSFGADRTRAGYDIGLYGGYRFTPVLSAEISMQWGKTGLSLRECCTDSHYWLGCDGVCYHAPVAGMDGWDYGELKSSVALQQYGVRLNVNLLGFFERTRHGRWTLEVSPLLAAVGTKATVKTVADNADVLKNGTRWHLGWGGNLQAAYCLTEHLNIGIYSGITCLTSGRMDGIPKNVHHSNYIWESGVRLGWSFGRGGKAKRPIPQTAVTEQLHEVCPEQPETPAIGDIKTDTIVAQSDDWRISPTDKVETETVAVEGKEEAAPAFPTIYFAFNRTDIAAGETGKMERIRRALEEHPDVHILVTGWCDSKGGVAVNDRISCRRAEAVKAWLVRHGIKGERIHTQGKGIDRKETDAEKARRAEIEEKGKEEAK